jgi:hypothetical protein
VAAIGLPHRVDERVNTAEPVRVIRFSSGDNQHIAGATPVAAPAIYGQRSLGERRRSVPGGDERVEALPLLGVD